jgi:hypothetical protein
VARENPDRADADRQIATEDNSGPPGAHGPGRTDPLAASGIAWLLGEPSCRNSTVCAATGGSSDVVRPADHRVDCIAAQRRDVFWLR